MASLHLVSNADYESGFIHMAAGTCVGMTGLAAGWTIGIIGDAGVRSFLEQPRIFVSMVLVLIFAEVSHIFMLSHVC